MPNTASNQPPEARTVLQRLVAQSAQATIIVPGDASQCPARLEAVTDRTITATALDPACVVQLLSGASHALVAIHTPTHNACFFANIWRVTEAGGAVFELPSQVSIVAQRESRRQVVPETLRVDAILQHGEDGCPVQIRDVSARGIGLVLVQADAPPPVGTRAELVLESVERRLVLDGEVAYVAGDRVGLSIDNTVQTSVLLEFAAFLGQGTA